MQQKACFKQFHLREYVPFVIYVGLIIIFAESLLHVRPIRNIIPLATPYYSLDVEKKRRAVEELLEQGNKVDVLFIGSSVVGRGFSPTKFDEVVAEESNIEVTSFNGWLSDLNPDPVSLYFEKFWLSHFKPKIVLQGVRYCELQAGVTACTYERFKSGRYEKLWMNSDRWSNIALELLDDLYLWHFKGFLPEYLRRLRMSPDWRGGAPIDARGMSVGKGQMVKALDGSRLPTPAEAQELLQYKIGYSGQPSEADFKTGLAALNKNAELCRLNNILYVVVNMPEHQDRQLLEPGGHDRYSFYLDQLERFADKNDVYFIDPTNGDPLAFGDEYFTYDHFHLNSRGSSRFVKLLASLMAPVLSNVFSENELVHGESH